MVYDKNKTGKVSKDDLPERMQHLVAQGDLNGDGYLDREELEKLALRPTKKGKGPKGPNAAVRAFTSTEAERAVNKLELKDDPKTKAQGRWTSSRKRPPRPASGVAPTFSSR